MSRYLSKNQNDQSPQFRHQLQTCISDASQWPLNAPEKLVQYCLHMDRWLDGSAVKSTGWLTPSLARPHTHTAAHPATAITPQKASGAVSSPPEGRLETKAGHTPTVKAGGMQIVQKHLHTGEGEEEKDKNEQEWESTRPPKLTVFISGVTARGDKDFPPAAAQVAHQQPHASRDKHVSPRTQRIQQPRK
ncbi:death-associated protein 1-like [Acomys russatus]|uniref:death-associated protein 1-like n=1 Tax=Acomys russatus TaxID=60746 RepID=UPI0021E1FD6E|nr:death-associated protein 1-like [Acomys russatus]